MNKATSGSKRGSDASGRFSRRKTSSRGRQATSDFLILSDGTILAHNLTPAMAAILKRVNPLDADMQKRAAVLSKPVKRAARSGTKPGPVAL